MFLSFCAETKTVTGDLEETESTLAVKISAESNTGKNKSTIDITAIMITVSIQ